MPITIPEPLIFALSSPTTPFKGIAVTTAKDGTYIACAMDGHDVFLHSRHFASPQGALDALETAVTAYLDARQPVLPASWRTPEPSEV